MRQTYGLLGVLGFEELTSFNRLSQKQPFADVLQNRCSKKFRNIHRETTVLESLFSKATFIKACKFVKKRIQHRCFPVNIVKFLRTAFFVEHPCACVLYMIYVYLIDMFNDYMILLYIFMLYAII